MEKELQEKINLLYGKTFRLRQEFKHTRKAVDAALTAAGEKCDELQEKYETDPSKTLASRLEKAEAEFSRLEDLLYVLDENNLSDTIEELGAYTKGKTAEYKQAELDATPKIPKKIFIKVLKREFHEQTNGFILHLIFWTTIDPRAAKLVLYWSDESNKWEPLSKKQDKLPYFGAGELFKFFLANRNEIYSNLYNGNGESTATFVRKENDEFTLSYSKDVPVK